MSIISDISGLLQIYNAIKKFFKRKKVMNITLLKNVFFKTDNAVFYLIKFRINGDNPIVEWQLNVTYKNNPIPYWISREETIAYFIKNRIHKRTDNLNVTESNIILYPDTEYIIRLQFKKNINQKGLRIELNGSAKDNQGQLYDVSLPIVEH